MSSFAWLDSSPEDRRRVLDALEQFKDTDSRDELGLATVRDGFANYFFPGTGTLQTRAGYFLFVPWLYLDLHRRKVNHDTVAAVGRRDEIKLVNALIASGDDDGVIGKVARDKLKRLPSSVYWNGLKTWRISRHDMTVDEYHRNFEWFREAAEGARDDDLHLLDGGSRTDWDPRIPPPPAEFPRTATFKLRDVDRKYLRDCINLTVGSSLLAWLLRKATTLKAETPWDHPQAPEYPDDIRVVLEHARCFSDAMHGAPILYNLMLAEEIPGDSRAELIERYRSWLRDWGGRLKPRNAHLRSWSMDSFWQAASRLMRVTPATRAFVEDWVALRGWETNGAIADDARARDLIRLRERQLKGRRARLGNPQALALWGQDSGTRLLVYRWPSAVRILQDLRPELAAHAES